LFNLNVVDAGQGFPFVQLVSNDETGFLGTKALARTTEKLVDAGIEGSSAFLGRICLPAAEEYGLLLKDRVSGWRAANAAKMIRKAEQILEGKPRNLKAAPRLVAEILENSSWIDDEEIQSMWAGLLASSCAETGGDDSNILFSTILKQLTRVQVRLLKHLCETNAKYASKSGLPYGTLVLMNVQALAAVTGEKDFHRLDRELDHLRSLELLGNGLNGGGGFDAETGIAMLAPTALALHLYVRGCGSRCSPVDFWKLERDPLLLKKEAAANAEAAAKISAAKSENI
jgi:hypothetical protein